MSMNQELDILESALAAVLNERLTEGATLAYLKNLERVSGVCLKELRGIYEEDTTTETTAAPEKTKATEAKEEVEKWLDEWASAINAVEEDRDTIYKHNRYGRYIPDGRFWLHDLSRFSL